MKKLIWFLGIMLVLIFTIPSNVSAEVMGSKKWNVTFSTDVDERTINDETVKVEKLNGDRVEVELHMKAPDELEIRPPSNGYTPGETYVLYVSSKIESTDGVRLKDEVFLDFTIEQENNTSNTGNAETYTHEVTGPLDAFEPSVLLDDYSIMEEDIDLMGIAKDGDNLTRTLKVDGERLSIDTSDGLLPLELNASYVLKVYMKSGARHYINFTTDGLPSLPQDTDGGVIMIPADPEEGFNYPYFLRLPSERYKEENEGKTRRLMVVPNNTGSSNEYVDTLKRTKEQIRGYSLSRVIPERLWVPTLTPAFPRYRVGYDHGYFYTHALDRYTMNVKNMLPNMRTDERFIDRIESEGLEIKDFNNLARVDLQLEAMIDHAINYLNERGEEIASDKVFLSGYSAEGNFTNRWAALHPDRVKAVASGGVNSTAIIPMEEYKGEELIYPIGVGDLEQLIGKPFDLEAYNRVANFMYQGEDDRNDTYQYGDTFGPEEKRLIKELMGEEMYPTRWENNKELYFESGANGAFGLYYDTGHEIPGDTVSDLIEFFEKNRAPDELWLPSSSSYVEVDKEISN
ncbi:MULTISPECIES: alpha/beta hydrolase family protein [Pontibacillus]|uniref:SbsA Ig-like domain-containing protein n=1 Tax=Pontibacillus chungwhensis TaxID=265426 RepID=A0ABY8UWQ4_9BACI|nr:MULTISPECIES: Ig-like domain-containing protein [Pontibacillus]MCD5324166.1 hypothetical protein [Pontibacillus sp. HN14]WIF97775.1 hypothetical protein QNI29_18935 [Pontibacillus chungwhensis]